MMKATLLTVACWCLVQIPLAAAEKPFPYVAQVAVDELSVHCGPSQEYYATQTLERGDSVKVYRQESDGWLAVRPPRGSFSWVKARHLEETDDPRMAKVVVDHAVAWIGTALSSIPQHKWQVQLDRGEHVEVLGKQPLQIAVGSSTETYVKIAPPAGEFRWVRSKQTSTALVKVAENPDEAIQLTNFRTANERSSGQLESLKQDAGQLAQRIEQLKVELSLLVTRDIAIWDLDTFDQQVRALARSVDDAQLNHELRGISDRIEEFRGLQQRYRRLAEIQSNPKPVSDSNASAAPRGLPDLFQSIDLLPIGTGVDSRSSTAAQVDELSLTDHSDDLTFDADGWLVPVHSTKRIAPPFALLDAEGRVRCYVQPSPGLNLRRYQRQQVGIVGQVRKVPALRASLVTAERVVKIKAPATDSP